jgi:predicted dinucleotide-binding enzyme
VPQTRHGTVRRGGDADANQAAAIPIRGASFDPVDAGSLRIARRVQPFTLLILRFVCEGQQGPALAYRFERIGARMMAGGLAGGRYGA